MYVDVPSLNFEIYDSIAANQIAKFRNADISFIKPVLASSTIKGDSGIRSGTHLSDTSYLKWVTISDIPITLSAGLGGSANFTSSNLIGLTIVGISGSLESPTGAAFRRSLGYDTGTDQGWNCTITTATGRVDVYADTAAGGASRVSLVVFYI